MSIYKNLSYLERVAAKSKIQSMNEDKLFGFFFETSFDSNLSDLWDVVPTSRLDIFDVRQVRDGEQGSHMVNKEDAIKLMLNIIDNFEDLPDELLFEAFEKAGDCRAEEVHVALSVIVYDKAEDTADWMTITEWDVFGDYKVV